MFSERVSVRPVAPEDFIADGRIPSVAVNGQCLVLQLAPRLKQNVGSQFLPMKLMTEIRWWHVVIPELLMGTQMAPVPCK